MKITILASTIALILFSGIAQALTVTTTKTDGSDTQIVDPYKDDDNSPWTLSMQPVSTIGGTVLSGRASGFEGNGTQGFDTFAPFQASKSSLVDGYGSSTVGFGCDGMNLGGIIDGQLSQYSEMIEAFISQAPALAIMYLAYSQPTVKAVIDELNMVGQFGLDLSNATCSGVRALADKAAEEKQQTMAEAQCTAEAGYKDPDCMSGDGISSSLVKVMKTTKQTVSSRTSSLMGEVTSASGGLVSFNGNNGSSSTVGGANDNKVSSRNCPSHKVQGILGLVLASSELSCDDIKNYAGLLPNYSSQEDVSGVNPRTMTLLDLNKRMTTQYYSWIQNALETPRASFNESEGFKALVNRIGMVITDSEHRALNKLALTNPGEFVAVHRNMATIAAVKDLSQVVSRLEIGISTGIQNQPDSELLTDRQINQFLHSTATLRTELNALTEQINLDLQRAALLRGGK